MILHYKNKGLSLEVTEFVIIFSDVIQKSHLKVIFRGR